MLSGGDGWRSGRGSSHLTEVCGFLVEWWAFLIEVLTPLWILISDFYQIFLILGDSVLLGGFKIEDDFLGVSGVDNKLYGCRSGGDIILYDRNE